MLHTFDKASYLQRIESLQDLYSSMATTSGMQKSVRALGDFVPTKRCHYHSPKPLFKTRTPQHNHPPTPQAFISRVVQTGSFRYMRTDERQLSP